MTPFADPMSATAIPRPPAAVTNRIRTVLDFLKILLAVFRAPTVCPGAPTSPVKDPADSMPRLFTRPCRSRRPGPARVSLGALLGLGLLVSPTLNAAETVRRSFDIPAGDAASALRQFAAQSGEQLLFSPDDVGGIETFAVRGDFPSLGALAVMLARTPLQARQDELTKAISITPTPPPRGPPVPPQADPNSEPKQPPAPKSSPSSPVKSRSLLSALAILFASDSASAQSAPVPASSTSAASATEEPAIKLSPFTIEADAERGWVATQTLGGSRMKTDFKDIAQPLEVMTLDFMQDMGVTNFEQALLYSTNVEGREEITDGDGLGFGVFQPRNTTRVRGLTGATLSRNFFEAQMPTDNYNLDRITIARGPNAILFGLGSPAGIVDVSLQRAQLRKRSAALELQMNSEDSKRSAINLNLPLVKGKLAMRVAAVSEEAVTHVKPNLDRQDRYYGVVTAQPFANTTISLHGEKVNRFSNRAPRVMPVDAVSLWENASRVTGSGYTSDRPLFDNRVTGAVNPGGFTVGNLANSPVFARQGLPAVMLFGAGALTGNFQSWNNSVEAREPQNIPTALNPYNSLDRQAFTLRDARIVPLDLNLFGNSRGQKLNSDLMNVFLEQRLAENLFLELAYNREDLDERTADSGFSAGTIKVDANRFLPDGVTTNPNAGRYYIQGRATGSEFWENREDWRATLSYEFDFAKKFRGSKIFPWLGRHRLAGLASGSDFTRRGHQLQRGIIDAAPVVNGVTYTTGTVGRPTGTGTLNWATDGRRDLQTRYYLNGPSGNIVGHPFGDLFGTWKFTDNAGRTINAPLFDSLYTNAEGWNLVRTGSGPEGTRTRVDTKMLALQSYLLKDRLVLLFGYRKDDAKSATIDPKYQVRDFSGLYPSAANARIGAWGAAQAGITRTIGAVAHLTRWASLTYNHSNTFQPNIGRFDPYGREYPGATGEADDVGVSLGLFDGKLLVRASHFQNSAGPTRAGNTGFNDPIRDQLYNIDNNLRLFDPALPAINAGQGGFREKGRANYWVTFDSESEGYELDLSWLPTRNWSFKLNAAKQDSVESNIGLEWFAWMAERLPVWKSLNVPEGGKSSPRDVDGNGTIGTWTWDTAPFDGNPASKTFARYFEEDVGSSVAFIKAVDGRGRSQGRNLRWNLIGDYKFTEGRLKGLGANLAFRFRSAPNLGYALKTLPDRTVTFDLDKPLEGKVESYVDLGLNYRGKMKFLGNVGYRVALNVRNLLDEQDLVPFRVLSTGQYVGYTRIEPRTFVFTLGFDL